MWLKGDGIKEKDEITWEGKLLNHPTKESLFRDVPNDKRCPRKLEHLPLKPCQKALNSIYQQGGEENQCPWFIVNSNANYCFWAYLALNPKEPHSLDEIARLTASNIATVNSIERRSLREFREYFLEEDKNKEDKKSPTDENQSD